MENDKQKVLERIRKMLAIANDSAASEGERDNALRMAHATLAKHNLSMAEAVAAGEQPDEAPLLKRTVVRDKVWARRAANAVARLFFCEVILIRGTSENGKVGIVIVGRPDNVATANEMIEYITKSIRSEAVRRSRNEAEPYTYRLAFSKGASDRVQIRCAELRKAAEGMTSDAKKPGTSLVLASFYEKERERNMAAANEALGETKMVVHKQSVPGYGYGDGHQYGKTLSLQKGIGGASKDVRRLK